MFNTIFMTLLGVVFFLMSSGCVIGWLMYPDVFGAGFYLVTFLLGLVGVAIICATDRLCELLRDIRDNSKRTKETVADLAAKAEQPQRVYNNDGRAVGFVGRKPP